MKNIASKRDTNIAAKTIGYFTHLPLLAHLDSAGQTALLPMLQPYHDNAKNQLATEFEIKNPDVAISKLLEFHKDFLTSVNLAANPVTKVKLSSSKTHRFYSLIYHLIDRPDGQFEQYRKAIEESFVALKLPAPLTKEELMPHVEEIVATKSPKLETQTQR